MNDLIKTKQSTNNPYIVGYQKSFQNCEKNVLLYCT